MSVIDFSKALYRDDLGIVIAIGEESTGTQPKKDVVAFFPRIQYGNQQSKRPGAAYPSSSRQDKRPCKRVFELTRAKDSELDIVTTVDAKLGKVHKFDGHKFVCGLTIVEKAFNTSQLTTSTIPKEEECVKWLEPARLLSSLPFTVDHPIDFQAPFLEALRKIRLVNALDTEWIVAVGVISGPDAGLTGWAWAWDEERELVAIGDEPRNLRKAQLDTTNHLYDAIAPLSTVFQRFASGTYVEFLPGSDSPGKRAFVIVHPIWTDKPDDADSSVVMDASVSCLLSDDPNTSEVRIENTFHVCTNLYCSSTRKYLVGSVPKLDQTRLE
jgi:hypothetical protein